MWYVMINSLFCLHNMDPSRLLQPNEELTRQWDVVFFRNTMLRKSLIHVTFRLCQLSWLLHVWRQTKQHAVINVASMHGCVVSYSCVWPHATQSATSLARSIKIKRRHLFWRLEMKVMFCLCLPWKRMAWYYGWFVIVGRCFMQHSVDP